MDSDTLSTSDEEQILCPSCNEPMDETDLTLYPCICNHQVLLKINLLFLDLLVVFEVFGG